MGPASTASFAAGAGATDGSADRGLAPRDELARWTHGICEQTAITTRRTLSVIAETKVAIAASTILIEAAAQRSADHQRDDRRR
jgi:hypothetical protein